MTLLTFKEYEAFAETIGEAALTMRLTAIEEKKWTLQYAAAGTLRLQKGFEGGGSIAEGATMTDGWVFYHQTLPVQTNGQNATSNDIFAAPPGTEFCLACHRLHEWLTIFIPTPLLFSTEVDLEFAASAKPLLLKPPPPCTEKFTGLAHRFLTIVESQPQLLSSPAALDSFQKECLEALREVFAKNQNSTNRHFNRWRSQAKLAEQLAQGDFDEARTVAELALESGVPERTLRTAFQRYYGLAPNEYLRVIRLHSAQQLLLSSCPDQTTVTQVAFELGFWDLGRFAGAYRRLFGELPSVTLRKSIK